METLETAWKAKASCACICGPSSKYGAVGATTLSTSRLRLVEHIALHPLR